MQHYKLYTLYMITR